MTKNNLKFPLSKQMYRIEGGELIATNYGEWLREYGSDETTTPNGVAPRVFVKEVSRRNWHLMQWGWSGGAANTVVEFTSKKDAELAMYGQWEYNIMEKNHEAPQIYPSKTEAIRQLADDRGKTAHTVRRWLIYCATVRHIAALNTQKANIEYQKRKAAAISEANTIVADTQFLADVKAAKLLSGNEKSKANHTALVELARRTGHGAIVTDFWTAYRQVIKNAHQ